MSNDEKTRPCEIEVPVDGRPYAIAVSVVRDTEGVRQTVAFECTCGHRIGTEYAGKRWDCPSCGIQLFFPLLTYEPVPREKPYGDLSRYNEEDYYGVGEVRRLIGLAESGIVEPLARHVEWVGGLTSSHDIGEDRFPPELGRFLAEVLRRSKKKPPGTQTKAYYENRRLAWYVTRVELRRDKNRNPREFVIPGTVPGVGLG